MNRANETGPIYGVPLMKELPLGNGGMKQSLPTRSDLEGIKDYRQGQRVVAGYEVLLSHYIRLLAKLDRIESEKEQCDYCHDTIYDGRCLTCEAMADSVLFDDAPQ